jgi:hypothetical protein
LQAANLIQGHSEALRQGYRHLIPGELTGHADRKAIGFQVRHAWRASPQMLLDQVTMLGRQFVGYEVD